MCTGAEIPLIMAAVGGEAAAASAPLVGAEIGAAGDLAAGLGGSSALMGSMGPGLLSEGLGAGAAGELGATSSGIGAAGGAGNPLSLLFGNLQSTLSPYTSRLGQGMKAYQGANAAMNMAGMGGRPPTAPPASMPPRGQAPLYSAQQVLGGHSPMAGGMPGSAGAVGGAMSMGGGQGLPPGLIQMLMKLQQQQGGM